MSKLEAHLARYHEFKDAAEATKSPGLKVEGWFLAAYHLIEACAAKRHLHIQKHQRVPAELRQNPIILGSRSETVAEAFLFLDNRARTRFVYGVGGSDADLDEAREKFGTIEEACLEVVA